MRPPSIVLLVVLSVALLASCTSHSAKSVTSWRLTLDIDPNVEDRERVLEETLSTIRNRLDLLGAKVSRLEIKSSAGVGRINLTLVDNLDRDRVKRIVTAPGGFELVAIVSPPSPTPVKVYKTKEEALASLGTNAPINRRVLPYLEHADATTHQWVVAEHPSIIDGADLRQARVAPGAGSEYAVFLDFKDDGRSKLLNWTGKHIKSYMGVVFNDEVKSIAFVGSETSDVGAISGAFDQGAAEEIAIILNSGPLPTPVKIMEERIEESPK